MTSVAAFPLAHAIINLNLKSGKGDPVKAKSPTSYHFDVHCIQPRLPKSSSPGLDFS